LCYFSGGAQQRQKILSNLSINSQTKGIFQDDVFICLEHSAVPLLDLKTFNLRLNHAWHPGK